MNQNRGISPRQERAILALLSAGSIDKAASACGVSRPTLWRWCNRDKAFQAAYREARARVFSQATGALQHLAMNAVEVLKAVMNNTKAAPTARVLAARSALEFGERRMEMEDLEARLSDLEHGACARPR